MSQISIQTECTSISWNSSPFSSSFGYAPANYSWRPLSRRNSTPPQQKSSLTGDIVYSFEQTIPPLYHGFAMRQGPNAHLCVDWPNFLPPSSVILSSPLAFTYRENTSKALQMSAPIFFPASRSVRRGKPLWPIRPNCATYEHA
jgi:hypothetical protein